MPTSSPPLLQVQFQSDNRGRGPVVAAVHWYHPGTTDIARRRAIWQFLTREHLDRFRVAGVHEVLLQHRGPFHPVLLYA